MKLTNLFSALAVAGALFLTGCPENKGTTGGASGGAAPAASTTPAGGAAAAASAMSDDAKHKLFQAGAATGDAQMIIEVNKKIGIMKGDGMPNDDYQKFVTEHGAWAQKNIDFITKEVNTPDKAKEYVKKNM